MPPPFERGFDAITKYLAHHVPGLELSRRGSTSAVTAQRGDKKVDLQFVEDELSDLEEALTNPNQPASYKNELIRDIMLRALIAVGKNGLAPDVDVAKLVANERLSTRPLGLLSISFDPDTARMLYEGLKTLDALARSLIGSDVQVPEIAQEHRTMASIIAYYEEKGHLTSPSVSGESLAYLKAAALCWICELEEKKNGITSERVKAAQSIRLFEILEEFWVQRPFDRIALPPIVNDYLAQRVTAPKKVVSGPAPSLDIGPLLKTLDPRLEERWRGAWEALRSENPDRVSQAANSMVEVLDRVIARVCGQTPFKDILAQRYPKQEGFILAQRATISALKSSLHAIKHETTAQSVHTAEDLMHAAEGVIRTLLRR